MKPKPDANGPSALKWTKFMTDVVGKNKQGGNMLDKRSEIFNELPKSWSGQRIKNLHEACIDWSQ